jgi:type VI secretion system Hcp family effector
VKIFLNIPEAKGEATATGYADQIECTAAHLGVSSQVDEATGTTVSRRYDRCVVTKAWDRSSPVLAQALIANATFPKATITFVQETPTFGAKHLMIELITVKVVLVEQSGAEGGALFPTDQVSFSFSSADVTFSPPGVSARKVSDPVGAL